MKKCLYRTQQYIFSLFVGLVQNKTTDLIRGENSLLKLPDLLIEDKVKSVLIVTTPGFIKRETLIPLFKLLEEKEIKYTVFTGVDPDPSVENVEEGVVVYNSNNCEAIAAIGGGSVLDCAKVLGARVSNPKTSVRKMRGMLKIKKPLPPYYPVPATCGTGSEVTAAAVISDTIDDKHFKYAVTDLKLIPQKAILDPKMLETLPNFMLATTAMDALTHAIEAYINLFASKQVVKDSLESVKLIFENIDSGLNNKDINSLDNLLYASTLAGISITHNFVGYVHALAHAIGAIYGLAHGYLNSIILPVILKKFEPKIEKKMAKICEICGLNKQGSYTDTVINELERINKLCDLPSSIKELKESDFDEIVRRANKEANPTYPVPMIFNKKDFIEVLYTLKA